MKPRYLLDTDTFVYIRRGRPVLAQSRFDKLKPGEAVISIITYGELTYGIRKKEAGPGSLHRLKELTQLIQVMPLPPEAAEHYGMIRADLSQRGQIIGANDLWIAAHALLLDVVLVTNNEREFRRIPALKVENWTK